MNKQIEQTEEFKIIGMSKPRSFTFENKYGCWWAKSGLTDDRFNALFNWAKNDEGFWKANNLIGTVQFEKKSDDGTPINGIVISVETK